MSLADLERDLRTIARKAPRDMIGTVRDGVRAGAVLTRANAERTSGAHGVHFPKSITAEMHAGRGLFGNSYSGEWGAEKNRPQGGMSFDEGSRNQSSPHLAHAKAADVVGPAFGQEVHRMTGRWFWP